MVLCKNGSFSLKASAGRQISSPCALSSWLPQCPGVSCTGCDVHTHLPNKSLLILRFCGLKSVLREVFDLLKQVHKRRIISGDALLTHRLTTGHPEPTELLRYRRHGTSLDRLTSNAPGLQSRYCCFKEICSSLNTST